MSAPGQRHSPFPIVMRGYDRDQVTDYIRRLDADLQMMTADRDSAHSNADDLYDRLEDARREMHSLRREVDTLSIPPTTVAGMSERVSRMLQLATDEAAELRSSAREEADETLSIARQEAQDRRTDATADATRTTELAQEKADSLITEAEKRAAAMDEKTEKVRLEAERTEEAANDRAREIIAAAEDDAARLRGAAHSVAMNRLARSRELAGAAHDAHGQILDHLAALRQHLGDLPDALALSGDEESLVAQTDSDDLELLNRTLLGRDRFESEAELDETEAGADARGTAERGSDDADFDRAGFDDAKPAESTDVLSAVSDDYRDGGFAEERYGTTRSTGDTGRKSATA
ncbi:hypothetical protein [Gordonia zhaorongruii]|uniref:hypothetical protein n=1 Tax=Gordonia zhaorongruii TaxID=2597659 RepID=UPI001042CE0C|nr:hypothetical protein [Gordonia zhaorongruii]